jgi:hypothetical protein
MVLFIYEIPAGCNNYSISTKKGSFVLNNKLPQSDRKYLHEAGIFKFIVKEKVQDAKETENDTTYEKPNESAAIKNSDG